MRTCLMSHKDGPCGDPPPPSGPVLSLAGLSPPTTQLPPSCGGERSHGPCAAQHCSDTTNMFATPSSYSVTPCKSNFARIPERASSIIRDVKRRSLRTCRAKAVSEKRLSGRGILPTDMINLILYPTVPALNGTTMCKYIESSYS